MRNAMATDPLGARQVLSFTDWCRLNNFSAATGRRILKRGDGPPIVQLSTRRIGIRLRDHDAWSEDRMRGGAAPSGNSPRSRC
jgi:hypothetical protein